MGSPVVLLIDNTLREGGKISPRIRRLEGIMGSFPAKVRTVHFRDLTARSVDMADAVVLSGSSLNLSQEGTSETMGQVIDLVRGTDLPVLGICFGFQLVMHSFGCTVRRNEGSEEFELPNGRTIDLEVTGGGGIIGRGTHPVNVAHRDYVDPGDPALDGRFEVLAVSRDGNLSYLQYARHLSRPVHGVQFHPEAFEGAPVPISETGRKVLRSFLGTVRSA